MKNKIALFGVSIVSCLVFSEAQAHFICLSNKTGDPQEIELTDSQGQRELVRLDGHENTCADIGDWQEFKATMSVPAENLCQGKRVYPGQWLVIDAKNGKTDCTAQMDRAGNQPTLKDYSHPFYFKNDSNTDYTVVQEPDGRDWSSECGYLEWVPLTVKAKSSSRLPIRMINTGMCFFKQTRIYGRIGGHLFTVGTSCINCGVHGYFWTNDHIKKPDNMKMYDDGGIHIDIW